MTQKDGTTNEEVLAVLIDRLRFFGRETTESGERDCGWEMRGSLDVVGEADARQASARSGGNNECMK